MGFVFESWHKNTIYRYIILVIIIYTYVFHSYTKYLGRKGYTSAEEFQFRKCGIRIRRRDERMNHTLDFIAVAYLAKPEPNHT
jgi:hypothetical protein